jgi:hypothetical protein
MQPRLSLVPAPATALAQRGTTSLGTLSYVGGAVTSPVCIAVAIFAACVGLGYAGVLGAILAMTTIVGLGATATRSSAVRRHIDQQRVMRERCRREIGRLKRLRASGPVRQQQYIELRDLVEHVERMDPTEAARFEMQDLLEHFIHLATTHQQCLDALRLAGSHDLPQTIPLASRSKRRREIQARRLRHREECLRQIDRLQDEMEAIDELVRLIAQRVACPHLEPDLEREIERRLWELDEVDEALNQLSA